MYVTTISIFRFSDEPIKCGSFFFRFIIECDTIMNSLCYKAITPHQRSNSCSSLPETVMPSFTMNTFKRYFQQNYFNPSIWVHKELPNLLKTYSSFMNPYKFKLYVFFFILWLWILVVPLVTIPNHIKRIREGQPGGSHYLRSMKNKCIENFHS